MTTYRLVRTGNSGGDTPKGSLTYDPNTKTFIYYTGEEDGDFPSYVYLPFYYGMMAHDNLIGIENATDGDAHSYIELGEGLSSDIRGISNPSYGGKLTNTGQVVKLTDGLGKSMLLPQGGDISSPEYKTGYYYVDGDDLPSDPLQDGYAYYVTKEYYGSMNFKLTATHVGTGRTFVGVNSDMTELVWKELTSGA